MLKGFVLYGALAVLLLIMLFPPILAVAAPLAGANAPVLATCLAVVRDGELWRVAQHSVLLVLLATIGSTALGVAGGVAVSRSAAQFLTCVSSGYREIPPAKPAASQTNLRAQPVPPFSTHLPKAA